MMIHLHNSSSPQSRRRGVTFAEILFAVMILAIGFIMLAGIFPVAIQQTQLTVQESAGSGLALAANRVIEQIANSGVPLTGDGLVHDLPFEMIRGNSVNVQDPRFAFVPMYRRVHGQPFAKIILICAQNSNRALYDTNDVIYHGTINPNLFPRPIKITNWTIGEPNEVTLADDPTRPALDAVAEGSFLVVRDGFMAGHVFRIAQQTDPNDRSRWQLYPSWGVPEYEKISDEASHIERYKTASSAYILGKGYDDPTSNTPAFTGNAMDVSTYTGYVMIKQ